MTGPSRKRSRADALQQALERYERALAAGADATEARDDLALQMGGDRGVFLLAAGLSEMRAPVPEPRSAEEFSARLRRARIVRRPRLARAPKLTLAPLAIAASIMFMAAILIPSFRSLPGDALYSVKGLSEDARVWVASGPAEARVRMDLASTRFDEIEGLVERARLQAISPGRAPVVLAAALEGIDDPRLAGLIEAALADAGRHIEAAADILISEPSDPEDLDELVEASQRGRAIASDVVEDLPDLVQPPVLQTAVKLAKIEAKAKAARMQVPDPTPPPCDPPTPTPTPEPTDTPTAVPATATPTAVATSSPDASPTPEPTPCVSPSPTPTPSPEPTPDETDETTPEPTSTPSEDDGTEEGDTERGNRRGLFGRDRGDAAGDEAAEA